MTRHCCIIVIMAVMALSSCRRMPLYDLERNLRLELQLLLDLGVDIDADINPDVDMVQHIPVPERHKVLFYAPAAGTLSHVEFVGSTGGSIYTPPGDYVMVVYSYGTEYTQIRGEEDIQTLEAFTSDTTTTKGAVLRSLTRTNADQPQGPIAYPPDHLLVARETVSIPRWTEEQQVVTLHATARTIVETYTFEVHSIVGMEYIQSCEAFVTNQARSSFLGRGEVSREPATLSFPVGVDRRRGCLYTTFTTFGKLPGESHSYLHILIRDSGGEEHHVTTDITDQFNNPDHHIIIDEEIVIPDPPSHGGGITTHLAGHDDQSTADKFLATDLLTGKGVGTMNTTDGTATLTLTMRHQMAMRIVRLAKWNGFVNVYGSYDTWVSPDDKKIWRMKQRLEPVAKKVCEPRWSEESPLTAEHYLRRVVDSEGNITDTENDDSDQCRYFFKLVRPDTGTAAGSPFGRHAPAKDGGWLLDIPSVPAGQYVMVKPLYYHWFRPLAEDYDKVVALTTPLTIKQAAKAAWGKADEVTDEWEKAYYTTLPNTWTYEETLFPYTENDSDRQQYDYILEVGDLLLPNGNLVKKSGIGSSMAVGRVMWIAWGCREYLEDSSSMTDNKGQGGGSAETHDFWNDDGSLYGWLRVKATSRTWQTGVEGLGYATNTYNIMNLETFVSLYSGFSAEGGRGPRAWSCEADGLRDDNGYRAKGIEQTDHGTPHFVVDHAAYGLASLDDYWDHEVCNHFLIFALSDDEVTGTVAYNDPAIFQ